MRFSLRFTCVLAVVSMACGPDVTTADPADDSAEVAGALMSNDDARAAMNDAFSRANKAGQGTPEAEKIIVQTLLSVGKKLPQTEVIAVLKDYVPYLSFSVVEAGRTNGVWKRATPKDATELVSFLGLLSFKMTDHATDTQNVMNRQTHAASVRAYLPSALSMIKHSTKATDMDVLAAVVQTVYPLTIGSAEFVSALRSAGLEKAPAGAGSSRGSGLNDLGLDAIFGGRVEGGKIVDRHDLASATSYEALVLSKLANSFVTYRQQWETERDSTMSLGDAMNDIARSTGKEPAVALFVLKSTLTASEYAAMQSLRAARR